MELIYTPFFVLIVNLCCIRIEVITTPHTHNQFASHSPLPDPERPRHFFCLLIFSLSAYILTTLCFETCLLLRPVACLIWTDWMGSARPLTRILLSSLSRVSIFSSNRQQEAGSGTGRISKLLGISNSSFETEMHSSVANVRKCTDSCKETEAKQDWTDGYSLNGERSSVLRSVPSLIRVSC